MKIHLTLNYIRPSFSEGIARILDFGGTWRDYFSQTREKGHALLHSTNGRISFKIGVDIDKSIAEMFASDWKAVEGDLSKSNRKVVATINPETRLIVEKKIAERRFK